MGLLEELQENIVVADGAMGTLLYSHGIGNCFEELNISKPEQVKKIHRAYIDVGAQVIQTNTYGANYEKLSRYGLEDQVKAINTAAVRLAKTVVKEYKKAHEERREQLPYEHKYILGTIGGIRTSPGKPILLSEVKRSFREQLHHLLAEGVDGLLLETYYDLEELETVLAIARKETGLPLIAQLSLPEVALVQGGLTVKEAFAKLETSGADVVGLNCRMGPHHMIRSLETVPLPSRAYLSAYPNASLPSYDNGRYHYSANDDYFQKAAIALREQGVRLIGGCCGTTPAHIKAVAEAVKGKQPLTEKKIARLPAQPALEITPPTAGKKTAVPLHEAVATRKTVIVELDPPKNLITSNYLLGAKALKDAGVDAVTLADNSLATPRICNLSMSVLVKRQVDVPPIVHITCRDRNLIGLQSHLMGLSALGLENILAITGDPAKVGDFPGATSVYDLSSFELIQLIKQCNEGISFTGKSLGRKTNFTVAAAFNPNVRHLEKAVQRLEKKVAHGADYFLTQPVFSTGQMSEIYEHTKHIKAPIFLGIMPLTGYQNAEFLHHEVPGIKLTDDIRRTMAACRDDKQQAKKQGIAIAKHLIDGALEYFNGIYLITPFMRYDITVELTEYIRAKTGAATVSHS
ncbi:homocysteine S-methyltransferase [Evansella caseinilytica]|uniref:Homocysteine S-methyltransferase n=1 Tax=Evansella caseinilytica TaxID=1503961 RepID=A0A1H3RZ14_9BACI|nr:bifunctional homocysteine S-methyltransferase/methylenetetrahydrofolate reductase [Evansella caseinilytica]SDZ30515.1 homocysteine S-methyltransferase [Evansella caseinilytica]